jgi:hypothetical protein
MADLWFDSPYIVAIGALSTTGFDIYYGIILQVSYIRLEN